METMETVWLEFQPTPRAIVVLGMNLGEDIRGDLATLLEDEGYTVIEAEDLAEARALINATAAPMVAVVGSVGMRDQDGMEYFTAVSASSAAHSASIYVTNIPEHQRLPVLVYSLPQTEAARPGKSCELVTLVGMVGEAAARVYEMR
jgi:DNA-binding NtrC family response regulator